MRILILCTGNSCRSQMAHGFMQSFDPRLEVHSAGTRPAAQVNPKAVLVMNEAGVDISGHTPKNVDIYLNQEWDYVITVCGGANESCPSFTGKVANRLHIGFEDPSEAIGSEEYIMSEFCRVRDFIRDKFFQLYVEMNQKIAVCPKCGGKSVKIVYGEPSVEICKAAERGEVILGGCCIAVDDKGNILAPEWECAQCSCRF